MMKEMRLHHSLPNVVLHLGKLKLQSAGQLLRIPLSRHSSALHHGVHHILHILIAPYLSTFSIINGRHIIIEIERVRTAEASDKVPRCYALHFLNFICSLFSFRQEMIL